MRPIGGEIETNFNEDIFFTDSGRSSLRLFLKNFKSKKILIPDFLCEIIIKVLKEEKINYSFYHINEDLSIDYEGIKNQKFDVLYVINYFGVLHNQQQLQNIIRDKILIEDNVFFYNFENRGFKNWYSFNSYRKITSLADGSLIKTNIKIKKDFIKDKNIFSELKYKAKCKKYNYVYHKEGKEEIYLKLFQEGEKILDEQRFIGKISDKSIYLLANYEYTKIRKLRKNRFKILYKKFSKYLLNKNALEYSYFVLKLNNRDKIRKKLFEYNIFLPVHWPKLTDNVLYNKVISIPLFENYLEEDFNYMINTIEKVINEY